MSTETEFERLAVALAGSMKLKEAVEADIGNLPKAIAELSAAIAAFGNRRESDAIVALTYLGYRSRASEVGRVAQEGLDLCARFGGHKEPRSIGASSNYIVSLAYGTQCNVALPLDQGDLDACERAVSLLPKHRHTPAVLRALDAARAALITKHSAKGAA